MDLLVQVQNVKKILIYYFFLPIFLIILSFVKENKIKNHINIYTVLNDLHTFCLRFGRKFEAKFNLFQGLQFQV